MYVGEGQGEAGIGDLREYQIHYFHFRGEGLKAGEGKGHAFRQGEVMADSQLGSGVCLHFPGSVKA